MSRHVALQMDAWAKINPTTDSTLRLGLEAQRRGYTVWSYTPDKLFYADNTVKALASEVSLTAGTENFHSLKDTQEKNVADFDVVWLRQDPPFNMAYITTTLMLSHVHNNAKTVVVNNPCSVRNLPEKWFPTELAEFMPPTLISADLDGLVEFYNEYGHIVIKPLYGHAGNGIFQLKPDEPDVRKRLSDVLENDSTPLVAQKFLTEMKDGERRIALIDGKFAAIAARIPAEGQVAAATRLGGHYEKAEATKRQMEICEAVGPLLKERGLIYTGLDVIGDWLTEINITSPTSIPQLNDLYGLTLESDIWDAVERYLP